MTSLVPFDAVREEVAWHGLTLVRSHPRPDRLHLDLADEAGDRVIGQWLPAPAAEQVATETEAAAPGRTRLLGAHLLLQSGGADRRLTGLAALVERGAELVVHRPERRAVVRTGTGPQAWWTKVVRPRRVADLRRRMEHAATIPGLRAPQVEATDESAGTITLSTLPGRTLHDLLTDRVPAGTAEEVGLVVHTLHHRGGGPPPWVAAHDLAAEVAATRGLLDLAQAHHALAPGEIAALEQAVEHAASRVAEAGAAARPALLHRDLHDKQLLVDGDARAPRVGMLDADTLGAGDPALDLGNVLAHLDLRVRQGWTSSRTAAQVEAGLLDGYRPDRRTRRATEGYRDLTRARLRALYAFRPGDLSPEAATG